MPETMEELGTENRLSDEEKQSLQAKVNDARKLKALTEHPGWTEVLLPRLKNLREGLVGKLLTQQLDLPGFQLVQQSVNAIDNIIGGINFSIAAGEQAGKTLKEEATGKQET